MNFDLDYVNKAFDKTGFVNEDNYGTNIIQFSNHYLEKARPRIAHGLVNPILAPPVTSSWPMFSSKRKNSYFGNLEIYPYSSNYTFNIGFRFSQILGQAYEDTIFKPCIHSAGSPQSYRFEDIFFTDFYIVLLVGGFDDFQFRFEGWELIYKN